MPDDVSKSNKLATRDNILFDDISELKPAEALQAWAFLDFVEKRLKERKELVRSLLFERAEAEGKANAKGSHILVTGTGKVIKERRQAKAPDEKALLELLKKKDIPALEAFDEQKVLKANPSKIEHLVSVGKLTEEEAEATKKKPTWALKVVLGEELNLRLTEAANRYYSGNPKLLGDK